MSEEFVPPDDEEAKENIEEFVEEHGLEGFLILYNRQLIYRFVKQELLSGSEEIDDLGEQMYFGEDGDDALHDKRQELKRHSEKWARRLVRQLKQEETIGGVIEADEFERLDDEVVQNKWEEAFHRTLEEWHEKADLYVEKEQQTLPSADQDEL